MPLTVLTVEANTEVVDFPIHEAAKRGNVTFMKECIANKASNGTSSVDVIK